MLEIRSLERVPMQLPPTRPSRWGVRQRLLLLGCAVLAIAALLAFLLYLQWPVPPKSPESIVWVVGRDGGTGPLQRTTGELTLIESFLVWQSMPRELDSALRGPRDAYAEAVRTSRNWAVVVAVVAALGGLCAASSLLVQAPPSRRIPPRG